ncbi:MAG: TlpA disulfide reductase family protein [Myxococcota bacterium]
MRKMRIRWRMAIGLCLVWRLSGATASAESSGEADAAQARTDRFAGQVQVLSAPRSVPAYAFAERLTDGSTVERAMVDFRGRVVVLNFWATWCGVCRRELPKFDALVARLREAGLPVDVVALSIDDGLDDAARALERRGHARLRVFHDAQGVLAPLLGVVGVPTTFVVDPDGRAVASTVGPADWDSPAAVRWLEGRVAKPSSGAAGGEDAPAAEGA